MLMIESDYQNMDVGPVRTRLRPSSRSSKEGQLVNELLELCGFDEQEKQTQLPRIQETFSRLGITEDDIQTAKGGSTSTTTWICSAPGG